MRMIRYSIHSALINLLALLAILLATPNCSGQGQVDFANLNWNVDAPIFDADGTTPLGSNFFGQLYVGSTADNVAPSGVPVRFQDQPGAAGSGYIFAPETLVVPSAAGTVVSVELRAWDANGGASYEAAAAAGAKVGKSTAFPITVGGGTSPPGTLAGLQSFSVQGGTPPPVSIIVNGSLKLEVYFEIPGANVSDLLASPKYPIAPDLVENISTFETPSNIAEDYGQRISGFIIPPVTGFYTFYLASDDQSELYLSANDSPSLIQLIAREPLWNSPRAWTSTFQRPAQENISAALPLQAHQRYYIEVRMKEGRVLDNLAVAWRKPGDPVPVDGSDPIPGEFLAHEEPDTVQAPAIVVGPQSQVAYVGGVLELSVSASGTQPFTYEWRRNGTVIPGETSRVLRFPNVSAAAAGDYSVTVSNSVSSASSDVATVTVQFLAGPIRNPGTGNLYYLLDANSWTESEAAAVRLGGHLVTIRNQDEQDWVFNTFGSYGGINRNLWIGLHDPDQSNNSTDPTFRQFEFVWTSGEPLNFFNWVSGEPNDYAGREYYVHMWLPGYGVSGYWNDNADAPSDNQPTFPWNGVVEKRLEIQCPDDLTLCPSDSRDPKFTGRPTIISSCAPEDQLIFTYADFNSGDIINRQWEVYDPVCGYSKFCFQNFNIVQQDNPQLSVTQLYGGMIWRLEAFGTRGTIVNATWSYNGDTLFEGNGVHFLDAVHSAVDIDFTVFSGATPGDFFSINVSVQTSCTAQGGAGAGGTVPPIFTLSRIPGATTSGEVDFGNTSMSIDCNGNPTTFGFDSRWIRFKVQDAGLAQIHVTSPTTHLAAMQPGADPTQPDVIVCGVQDIEFPAEAGKTYIVAVSGEAFFILTAQSTLTPPQIQCPPDVTICRSDSSDPSSTGFATLISACSRADQVQITYQDTLSDSGIIQRTWRAIDPVCGASDPCFQNINIFFSDSPDVVSSSEYSGLVVTFGATGTRRPITSAVWNINGITLTEGNGVHFDDAQTVTIDFTVFNGVSPSEPYSIEVFTQTTCGIGLGGGGGTVPPLYALSRSLSPTVPSTDVDVANKSIDINCQASLPTTFGNGSRWFRFKIDDAQRGVATIPAGNPSARLTALAPGVSPTQPLSIACGTGQIQFVAEPATTYIIVVDGADNFVLTPTLADITRVINLSGNLAFGDHQVGTASKATLTIANPGNSTLTVNSLIYPAGFSGDWPGGTIAAGASKDVTVSFTPTAPISYGGDIVVDCDSTSGVKTITASGAGIATRIINLSGNLAVGEIQVGATKTATLKIANDGNSALTVNSIAYPVGFSGDWAGGIIAPGTFQNITVTFSPTAPISYGGNIVVDCNSTSGNKTIAASGSGIPTRIVRLTGNLAFGDHQVGTTSTTTLNIANLGNSTLTVNTVTFPPGFTGDWPGGTIAAGASKDVTVSFTPTAPISYGGDIVVDCDSTSGVKTIAASGAGIATRIINLSGNLAFGEVQVGATKTAALKIANDGNSALTVNGLTYPTGFSGNWAGGIIAPGAFQNITVTFSPTAPISYGGSIVVDCNSTSGNKTIAASGSGIPTRIVRLTGNLAFGDHQVGTTSTATLNIANLGNSTLTVNTVTFPPGFTGDWPGGTIAAGASKDVTVSFTPTAPISYGGDIVVDCDSTSGTKTITASGAGIPTRIVRLEAAPPGSLAFGEVQVNSTKTTTLKIFNDGNSILTVNSLTYPSGFSGNWANGTIAPGAFQSVTVTFTPTAPISYGGDIIVDCDSTSGTKTTTASGAGIPTRIVRLEAAPPGSLAFGEVQVNSTKTTTLKVFNDGNSTLTVNSLTYPTGFSGDWPGGTIAAGASKDVTVSFTPTAPLSFGGDIVANCDSTSGTKTIPASGTGIATRIINLSGDLTFGEIQVGATKTAMLKISNNGNSALTVNSITYPTGFGGDWVNGTISAGASQDVTVTFSPTAAISYGGNVAVDCNSTAGNKTIAASGSGIPTRIIRIEPASPIGLVFGEIEVNSTKTAPFKIFNDGNSTLTVTALVYPAGFKGDWPGGSIAPGTSKDVNVTFSPTAPIPYGGNISLDCNSTAGDKTTPVSGSGMAIRIINLTGDLAFGSLKVADTKTATLNISNTGNSTLIVNALIFPSGFSGDWNGGKIAPGGSTNVTVTFSPNAPITYEGDIVVDCDATSGQKTIHVSGAGFVLKFVLADLQNPVDGKFHLSLSSEPGKTVILQVSIDLVHWSDVATLQSIVGNLKFDDQLPADAEQRFYRFRVE